jgi:hypothetical protein
VRQERAMYADEFVPVYCPYDTIEAYLIKQALEDEGIYTHLEGELQASLAGGGFMSNAGRWRMRLLVRADDAERARAVITARKWPTSGSPSGAE